MSNIPIGTRGEEVLVVTSQVAIDFLGREGARVLATPEMIRYMERACRRSILPLLDPGFETVGTHVDVSHLAAALIGSTVTFTSEVIAVEGKRIRFHVEARGEKGLIGEGTHERAVINVEKFAARLASR